MPYEANENDIALRGGGEAVSSNHAKRFEFFVGTEREFNDFDFEKWMTYDDE